MSIHVTYTNKHRHLTYLPKCTKIVSTKMTPGCEEQNRVKNVDLSPCVDHK